MDSILATFVKRVSRNNRIAAAIVALVIVTAGVGTSRLEVVNDYAAQLGSNNPELLAYQEMTDNFTTDDSVFIAIEPLTGDVFERDLLMLIEELTALSWKTPYSTRVDSISNFQFTEVHLDDLEVKPLFEETASLTTEQINARREIALTEPSLRNILVSDSGKNAGIRITISLPRGAARDAAIETSRSVYKLLANYEGENRIATFRLSGKIIQDDSFFKASRSDGAVLFPIMFGLIGLVLLLLLRSFSLLLAAISCTGMAVLGAAGVIGWSSVPYTAEGIAALSMIIPLSTADNVHVLSNYLRLRADMDSRTAMQESLKVNVMPVFITTITTCIGFLSLNFAQSPPVRLIGNTVAVGMMFAFFTSLVVLPFLVVNFTRFNQNSVMARADSAERFADWVVSHHKTLSAAVLVLMVLSLSGLSKLTFDQTNIESFRPDNRFRQDAIWIDNNLTGTEGMSFVIDSKENAGVSKTDYLFALDEFSNWLKEQPKVVSVSTFSDVVKRLNRDFNGGLDEHYQLPNDNALSAQYVLFYQQSLPFGLDLGNQLDITQSASRVMVSMNSLSNQQIVQFEQNATNWLQDNLKPGYSFYSSSASTLFAHQIDRNIQGLLKALITTLLLVSAILMVTLRSWRLGLISLVPNVLPGAMAFGLWSLLFGDIGLLVIMAFAITLGVIVDDTVHLLVKYQAGKQTPSAQHLCLKNSVRYSLNHVAMACFATTLALALGFASLTFSEFTPHADMGIMCAMAMVIALIVDFFLLPTLLLKWDTKHASKNTEETH